MNVVDRHPADAELPGNRWGLLTSSDPAADLPHQRFAENGVTVAAAARNPLGSCSRRMPLARRLESCAGRMGFVLRVGDVLQVCETVVVFAPVAVIDFMSWWARPGKSQHDQNVYPPLARPPLEVEVGNHVTLASPGQLQHPSVLSVGGCAVTPQSSPVAHRVRSLVLRNRQPALSSRRMFVSHGRPFRCKGGRGQRRRGASTPCRLAHCIPGPARR